MSEEPKTSSGQQSLKWLLENAPTTAEALKLFALAWLLGEKAGLEAFVSVAARALVALNDLNNKQPNARTLATLQHLIILFDLAQGRITRLAESNKPNDLQRPDPRA